MVIIDLLKKLGYNTVSESYYGHIDTWKSWFRGKVESFHSYEVYNGTNMLKLEKATLGMAKTVSEDWANYIFNKDTKMTTGTEEQDNVMRAFMDKVRFMTNINECVESAFSMGTCAVVIVENEKGVDLNYIKDASMIFPLTWDNGEIIDCCFASVKYIGGNKCYYLNIHEQHGEKWLISNKFYKMGENGEIEAEITVDGVMPEVVSDYKRYFVYSPALLNNIDPLSPLGMSIFANGIDALKGIDTVYDSYLNEFNLGKKRIMVGHNLVKQTVDHDTGRSVPIFDSNDTTFYHLPGDAMGDTTIKEIDMSLRVQEHKDALQDMLNCLSIKIGMGTKHYSFVGGAVTATEIKSTSDTLYNSMVKHEGPLSEFLKGVIEASMLAQGYDVDVSVEYDDSVIRDTNADLVNNLQLLQNRIIGRADVAAWWKGCDRDKALDYINQIDTEDGHSGLFDNTIE